VVVLAVVLVVVVVVVVAVIVHEKSKSVLPWDFPFTLTYSVAFVPLDLIEGYCYY
jgi:hypothetical protein